MEDIKVKIGFEYQDQYGNITHTEVERLTTSDDEINPIIEAFKAFLVTCTFSEELINTRIK